MAGCTTNTRARALAATVKEQVASLIELIFPPRDIEVSPEGLGEVVTHMPHVGQPEEPEADGLADFVIYVDEARYQGTEEGDDYVIRPIPVVYSREDVRDMQAALLEGLSEEEAEAEIDRFLEELQAQLVERYETVSDIGENQGPAGLCLTAQAGSAWDDACLDIRVVDNGEGGVFVLTARYFLEAAEGHGVRMAAMMDAFEVVPEMVDK